MTTPTIPPNPQNPSQSVGEGTFNWAKFFRRLGLIVAMLLFAGAAERLAYVIYLNYAYPTGKDLSPDVDWYWPGLFALIGFVQFAVLLILGCLILFASRSGRSRGARYGGTGVRSKRPHFRAFPMKKEGLTSPTNGVVGSPDKVA